MRKYIIFTDSCSDLGKKYRDEFGIKHLCNTYSYDGKVIRADLDWTEQSPKEYYDLMRNGKTMTTSQVNAIEYREAFEKAINEGYDVLSISVSTGLSNSYNISIMVKNELLEKYKDAKIVCIDSLNACSGLALICIRAGEMQKEGKSIEEVENWILENRLKMHQEAIVDKLVYLKRAGRVSAASAFFGGLLNIKPIIISDVKGRNVAVEKVKGKKASFMRVAQRVLEKIIDVPYQRILIGHADCLNEAIEMKNLLIETLGKKDLNIDIANIGPIIGATVGPGTIGVYFWGTEETHDADKQ